MALKLKMLPVLLGILLAAAAAQAENRRVYEGVVDLKQKPIGTLILLEVGAGNSLSGWIRLGRFVQIEGGAIGDNSVEFRAAGNTYNIDEMRGRIAYSGPDGNGNSVVTRMTPVTGAFDELTEGEQFGEYNIVTMQVDARMRRFQAVSPSLWKRVGPPFEKFQRLEELLQRQVTIWVSSPDGESGTIGIIEEPQGMDIPLKLPKKPKEKK